MRHPLISLQAQTRSLRAALLVLVAACSAPRPAGGPTPASAEPAGATSFATPGSDADVDHLILAIDSLARGVAMLREMTGLEAAFGGVHPGRGTQNALLSLGPGRYLELLAPNPADAAGARTVAEFSRYRTLTPYGWAARTANADTLRALAVTRGLPGGMIRDGSRRRPDGVMLRWRTFVPWGRGSDLLLPFFIAWDPEGGHPSAGAPTGCSLAALSLRSPSPDSLRTLLERGGLRVPVSAARHEGLSFTLACPKGRVTFVNDGG